jgi:hypothetical protein
MDDFDDYFPILHRVLEDETHVDRMEPQEIDQVGEEVAAIFELCSKPESKEESMDDLVFHKVMMECIRTMDYNLRDRAKRSMNSRDGALLVLFQKTVATLTNLKGLFIMCDPTIRTGSIRRNALEWLYDLAHIDSVWKLHVPGNVRSGEQAPSSRSFGKKLIETLINTIKMEQCFCNGDDDSSNEDDSQHVCHECVTGPWIELYNALPRAFDCVPPNEVLDMLNTIQDWPRRLQDETIYDNRVLLGPWNEVLFQKGLELTKNVNAKKRNI